MPSWSSWPAAPSAVAARSREVTDAGDAVKGLAAGRRGTGATSRRIARALEAKLLALQDVAKETRNGLEHAWLGYGIRGVEKQLAPPTDAK